MRVSILLNNEEAMKIGKFCAEWKKFADEWPPAISGAEGLSDGYEIIRLEDGMMHSSF